METAAQDSLREKTLLVAKRHKASWIELGQYLYAIYKDKHYRAWGHLTFETYCMKELRLKEATALKLIKSYSFLETEKPELAKNSRSPEEIERVPQYEAVNVLRLASNNKNLTPQNVYSLKKAVFESEKDAKEVKAQVKTMLAEREDDREPQEIKRSRRNAIIKRLVSSLSNAKKEFESERLLPGYLLEQMGSLISKLEDQLE